MYLDKTIAEIEWLERIFSVPDTRPLSPSDIEHPGNTALRISSGVRALAKRETSTFQANSMVTMIAELRWRSRCVQPCPELSGWLETFDNTERRHSRTHLGRVSLK